MIFFSDLDRTIICSKRLIDKFNNLICIEKNNNKDITYVTKEIIDLLSEINQYETFIPTTTRTVEEYRRIEFEKYNLFFKYAITSNGAVILKNGVPLEAWSEELNKKKKENISLECMFEKFKAYLKRKECYSEKIEKVRVAENHFFYLVFSNKEEDMTFLNEFIKFIEESNWSYYRNGRKVYFLPSFITKENAIKFLIKEEFKNSEYIALGDSVMDLGMLNGSFRAYVPKHGEISSIIGLSNVFVSNEYGLAGIEEILNNILETRFICDNK